MQTRSKSLLYPLYPLYPLLKKVEQNLIDPSSEKVEQNLIDPSSEKVEQKKCSLNIDEDLAQPFSKVDFSKVDFDEASRAWKLNKKSTGNGCYKYICTKITKTGKQCKNDSLRNCEFCRFHNKKM